MNVCMCTTRQPGSVVTAACLLSDGSCYHHAVHLCPSCQLSSLPLLFPILPPSSSHSFSASLPIASFLSFSSSSTPSRPLPPLPPILSLPLIPLLPLIRLFTLPPPAIFPLFHLPPPLPHVTKDVAITYLKVHQGTSDAAYITSHNRVLVRAGKGPSILSIHQKLANALYIRLDFQVLNGSTYPPALNFSRYSSHENMAHSSSLCVCDSVCVCIYIGMCVHVWVVGMCAYICRCAWCECACVTSLNPPAHYADVTLYLALVMLTCVCTYIIYRYQRVIDS